jgi:hypothetical protein
MPSSYGRSVAIAVSVFILTFSPYAHAADTSAFGINDPFTDAIQLWSAVLGSVSSLAHELAAALQLPHAVATTGMIKPHAQKTLQQPAALAASAALAIEPTPETATTFGSASNTSSNPTGPQTTGPPEATSDQTTQSPFVKSAVSAPLENSQVSPASPQPLAVETPTSDFVTQDQFNAAISALAASVQQLLAESNTNPFPENVGGDGNNANPYAAASAISQLSNVTISNPVITGGTVTATSFSGLLGVGSGGTGISATPSYGQLLVGNSSGTYTLVATSSLGITGAGSGSVGSGTQGQFAFYNAAGTTLTATSSLFMSQSGNVGIGMTAGTGW